MSRRRWLAASAGLLSLAWPLDAHATTPVPAARQAELLTKAGKYDRKMPGRSANGSLRLVFASRRGSADSREFVLLAWQRLIELGRIGEFALELAHAEVSEVSDLDAEIAREQTAIVFLSTQLRSQVRDVADRLRGHSILTVAASPDYVELGAVLGFDLVNGAPLLLVNLDQARAQGVDFNASFLKLAKIIG